MPHEKVNTYGCTACQTYHQEGEPLYQAHLQHQSKHGIVRATPREASETIARLNSAIKAQASTIARLHKENANLEIAHTNANISTGKMISARDKLQGQRDALLIAADALLAAAEYESVTAKEYEALRQAVAQGREG